MPEYAPWERIKHELILVALTPEQVELAKEQNGKAKRITHALICGPYGQIFGTEKFCLKYFAAWNPDYTEAILPNLFSRAVKTDSYEFTGYKTTWNMVGILIEANDSKRAGRPRRKPDNRTEGGIRHIN